MERIKVAIRLRPFLSNENDSNTGINMDPDDDKTIMISKSFKTFKGYFDKILSTDSTQKEVFDFIKPCLFNIKKGINCTILAYGQTGSGKTYTMFGKDWSFYENIKEKNNYLSKDEYNFILNKELVIDPFSETNGIIPNLIMQLFNSYNNNKENKKNKEDNIENKDSNDNNDNKENNENIENNENNNLNIECCYIQVYNEKIYDLLEPINENNENKKFEVYGNKYEKMIEQTPLRIKYDKIKGKIIEGVNEIKTNSFFDIFDILKEGEINRKIRQTNRNDMSSRSHTILIINIEDNNNQVKSKIKLCDLAGSERYISSEKYNKKHINELCSINKSLFVLGNVIHILASKRRNKFIPYKDSKLTEILEDSLSGNSCIYLIATISPNDENFDETINTLKFADRAREVMTSFTPNQIINNDILGEGNNKKEITKLYKELSDLKQLLFLREKRGNLNPLQTQFLKLQKENIQLKKYLGGGNNINVFEKLIKENNNLKKEIKELTSQNLILKNEKKILINENNNNDYNGMIVELQKKNFKNSLSENDIFNNHKYNIEGNGKNNINSNTLINTGNNIIVNKNNNYNLYNKNIKKNYTYDMDNNYTNEKKNLLIKKSFLSKEINNMNNGKTISNNINNKRIKLNSIKQRSNNSNRIKSNYKVNYNNINLEKLGIKTKFSNNNKIIESLKRLQILEDLSKKNKENN